MCKASVKGVFIYIDASEVDFVRFILLIPFYYIVNSNQLQQNGNAFVKFSILKHFRHSLRLERGKTLFFQGLSGPCGRFFSENVEIL